MSSLKTSFCFSLLLLLLVFGLTSCGSKAPVVETKEVVREVKVTVRDTVFVTQKDSSFYRAYIECVNGKPVIKQVIDASPGKALEKPKVSIEDNVLKVDCNKEAEKLFLQWKEKYVSESTTHTKPVIQYKLTFWQELQIKCFHLLLLIVLIYLVVKYGRLLWKKYKNTIPV